MHIAIIIWLYVPANLIYTNWLDARSKISNIGTRTIHTYIQYYWEFVSTAKLQSMPGLLRRKMYDYITLVIIK